MRNQLLTKLSELSGVSISDLAELSYTQLSKDVIKKEILTETPDYNRCSVYKFMEIMSEYGMFIYEQDNESGNELLSLALDRIYLSIIGKKSTIDETIEEEEINCNFEIMTPAYWHFIENQFLKNIIVFSEIDREKTVELLIALSQGRKGFFQSVECKDNKEKIISLAKKELEKPDVFAICLDWISTPDRWENYLKFLKDNWDKVEDRTAFSIKIGQGTHVLRRAAFLKINS